MKPVLVLPEVALRSPAIRGKVRVGDLLIALSIYSVNASTLDALGWHVPLP